MQHCPIRVPRVNASVYACRDPRLPFRIHKRISRNIPLLCREVKGRFVTEGPFDLIGKLDFAANERANSKTRATYPARLFCVTISRLDERYITLLIVSTPPC